MNREYKLKIYRDKKKKFRWTFIAKNGKIIADGAQGYTRKEKCLHGFDVMAACIDVRGYIVVDDTQE